MTDWKKTMKAAGERMYREIMPVAAFLFRYFIPSLLMVLGLLFVLLGPDNEFKLHAAILSAGCYSLLMGYLMRGVFVSTFDEWIRDKGYRRDFFDASPNVRLVLVTAYPLVIAFLFMYGFKSAF